MKKKDTPVRLGISACLLGHRARYDGGHRQAPLIADTLGPHVEFVPVCPESECGLGVPREVMRLEGLPDSPLLMTQKTRIDHTGRIQQWAATRVRELEKESLCGFIFKSRSPSCGLTRVKVYGLNNKVYKNGTGLFARSFMAHFPHLPTEEDELLHDSRSLEKFLARILACQAFPENI